MPAAGCHAAKNIAATDDYSDLYAKFCDFLDFRHDALNRDAVDAIAVVTHQCFA